MAKGACYLVGDSAVIDIWKDPRVPWIPNFIPQPRDESSQDSLVVSCLINQDTRSWDLTKLEQLFSQESVEAIKKIPLPVAPRLDQLIWILDPKGNFSIKSDSTLCYNNLESVDPNIQWKKMWKLNLHERLKILAWRIASDILPTNLNFVRRVGFGNPLCPLCNNYEESTLHLFFQCSISRSIWFGLSWGVHPDILNVHRCEDVVKLLTEPPMNAQGPIDLKNLKTHAAILMACTLDCIWCLRNKVVHGTTPINLPLIVKDLELSITKHLSSLSTVRIATAPLDPVMVWTPPPAGSIKINTDVAVHTNFSTLAVIARDHQGFVLKA